MKRKIPLCCGMLMMLLMGAVRASLAAPITFNTALPVAKDETIIRLQAKLLRSTDDQSGAGRELTVWSAPLVVAYGVTEKLALFGILPVVDKKLEINTAAGRVERGERGMGDTTAMLRYTAWKRDAPGKTVRLAPFVALKVPIGEDDSFDALGRLPQTLQLGSGSWDYSAGLVMTWQTLARQIDAALSYTLNTEANSFEFGDMIQGGSLISASALAP